MNAANRLLATCVDALRRPLLRRRLDDVVIERVCGVPLIVLPEVFNPVIFRTGVLLAETIAEGPSGLPEATSSPRRPRALDLGTGSGVGAIFAARHGYRVTAVDINPHAVRCARINALLNELDDLIEVVQGDLFAPVAGQRFDLVLFNPPFFRGEPEGPLDAAWRSVDVLERFAEQLPLFLRDDGRALIALSSHGEGDSLLQALAVQGLAVDVAGTRDCGNEVLQVHAVGRPVAVRSRPEEVLAG